MGEIDHCHHNREHLERLEEEIVMTREKDREKEEGMRDLQGKVKKREKMRWRRRRPLGMNYGSPKPWEKPWEMQPNGRHNLLRNTNMPKTKTSGFGLLPVNISLTGTHINRRTRQTESSMP